MKYIPRKFMHFLFIISSISNGLCEVLAITEKGQEVLPKKNYKLFENAETIGDMVIGFSQFEICGS